MICQMCEYDENVSLCINTDTLCDTHYFQWADEKLAYEYDIIRNFDMDVYA